MPAWPGVAAPAGGALGDEAPRPPPLRVAVYDVPPYGYVDVDGSIVGVSVDLWRRVAEQLEREFELTPVSDMEAVLGGLERQRFDAAIGAITITPDREERVDFSYPAHRSGVAIARRRDTGPLSALVAYGAAVSELSVLIALILGALVLAGSAMWAIERHTRAETHGESAIATLRDGLYWAVVTMTTVGYGDKTPKTTPGRLVATLWMFGSLVLVSLLSTSLVSRLTAERVERNDVASRSELSGKTLAAVTQSSGAEYLGRPASRLCPMSQSSRSARCAGRWAGRRGRQQRRCPALLRFEALRGSRGPAGSFWHRPIMAVALPQNSPLKRSIDRALIKITSEPEWMALEDRFFDR